MNFVRKERYTIEDLLAIMEALRSPEGCPWDREQTHASLRKCFLEETYEAVEAIDTGDVSLLEEELGDVLFQVVFHAQLEKERGSFDFGDVVNGIAAKMVLRHPHVFGTVSVEGTEDVLRNWDAIKQKSKQQKTQRQVLESVSKALPALMRAQKLQRKAGAGLEPQQAAAQAEECLLQLKKGEASQEEKSDALGRLLFAAAGLAEALHTDAEEALTRACGAFIEGFPAEEEKEKT